MASTLQLLRQAALSLLATRAPSVQGSALLWAPARTLWSGLGEGKAAGADETRSAWHPGNQAAAHAAAAGQEGAGAPSADAGTSSATAALPPLLGDVARVLEGPLGLKPGRDCVVGEGLATVDLALFIQGKQVAVQVEPAAESPVPNAKAYAESRTRQRVLQSFGWATASLSEREWLAAGSDDHKKMHLAIGAIKKALGLDGGDGSNGGHHHHHAGCGCSH